MTAHRDRRRRAVVRGLSPRAGARAAAALEARLAELAEQSATPVRERAEASGGSAGRRPARRPRSATPSRAPSGARSREAHATHARRVAAAEGRGAARVAAQGPHEREADRAAEVVARGGSVAGWSFSTASPPVQRDAAPGDRRGKRRGDDEKKKDALKKAGEAALETPQGQALKEKVLDDPLVKTVVDAVTSPAGIVADGRRARRRRHRARRDGQGAADPAAGRSRSRSITARPLGAGDVAGARSTAPTSVGLTITVQGAGPEGQEGARRRTRRAPRPRRAAGAAAHDPLRAREQGGGGAADDEQAIAVVRHAQTGLPGLTIPLTPPPKADEEGRACAPVQPAPASTSAAPPAHANVDGALSRPGRPLDPSARRSMEARFGYDFSGVRIHDDARAGGDRGGDRRGGVHRRRGHRVRARPLDPASAERQAAARARARARRATAAGHAPAKGRTGCAAAAGVDAPRARDAVRGSGWTTSGSTRATEGRRVAGDHSALAVARGIGALLRLGRVGAGHAIRRAAAGARGGAPGAGEASRWRRWPEAGARGVKRSSPRDAGRVRSPRPRRARAAAARQDVRRRRSAAARAISTKAVEFYKLWERRDGDADGLVSRGSCARPSRRTPRR